MDKVVPYTQEGLVGQFRGGIADAVPEVERRLVATLPKATIRFQGFSPMVPFEGDLSYSVGLQKPVKQQHPAIAQPPAQDQSGFNQSSGGHRQGRGLVQNVRQFLSVRLLKEDG